MELFKRGPALGFRLSVFIALSVAIMALDQRQQHMIYVHQALSVITTPIQYLVDLPLKTLDWLSERVTTKNALLSDNQQLKANQVLLQAKVQKFLALERENNRLRGLLQSSVRLREKVVVARLLALDANPYVHQFTLAKGSRDGVFVGQSVLDASGVLGQVIRVNPFTSQVLLLTDTRSAIPVENTRNGIRGIVVGVGDMNRLALIDTPKTENIKNGDLLVTSGLGQRFPAGYPVGTVGVVIHNPGEHFARINIHPKAQFNRSRFALLVWPHSKKK